jgi:hypothetical protein
VIHPWHLFKRFVGALTATTLTGSERNEVASLLLPGEHELFIKLTTPDQRHAIRVLRRFDVIAPDAPVVARRAALLHDIGKLASNLGTLKRVIASVVGMRLKSFHTYHHHERIGADMLTAAGSDLHTVALVRGDDDAGFIRELRRADEI